MFALTFNIFSRFSSDRNKLTIPSSIDPQDVIGTEFKEMDFQVLYQIIENKKSLKVFRGVERDNMATCRRSVIKTYMTYMQGLTKPQKAQLLVDFANAKGLTEHFYLSGTRLNGMAEDKNVPAWAYTSAIELMLEQGWLPQVNNASSIISQTDEDTFAMFIFYWMIEFGPFVSIDQVLQSLPGNINKTRAEQWIVFLVDRLGKAQGKQLYCYFADKNGSTIGEVKTSFLTLANDLKELIETHSYHQLKRKGYQLMYCFKKV
jgi:hypothetical protein